MVLFEVYYSRLIGYFILFGCRMGDQNMVDDLAEGFGDLRITELYIYFFRTVIWEFEKPNSFKVGRM